MKNQLFLSALVLGLTLNSHATETKVIEKKQTETVETTTVTETEKNSDTKSSEKETLKSKAESAFDKTKTAAEEVSKKVAKEMNETHDRREKSSYFALLNYSPLDLLIPSKIGATFGVISNADKTWELEYLRGSMSIPFIIEDLGKLTDQRISLIRRSYGVNSFNFNYGLSYFSLKLHIGDELLNKISGVYPSYDVVDLRSIGFNIGVGNRWIFQKNITFGVDWFEWSQPVYVINKKSTFLDYATDPQDRDDMEAAIKVLSYFPRLTFLKLQFGMTF